MKPNLTHIIFIVDRSGSMDGIAADMIGGYNKFIETQKELPADCFVSFYQFDDIYEAVFERVALKDVKPLDKKTYQPRGCTALYDAMGRTIKNYGQYLSDLSEEERPERILVVAITDGLNNASREFDLDQVREMIKHQTEVYKWDFVFLGSNIDAWNAGQAMGVVPSSTLQFANTKGSVGSAFQSLSRNTRQYRASNMKCAYSFDAKSFEDQDAHLTGDQKAKNKQAEDDAKKTPKKTTTKK